MNTLHHPTDSDNLIPVIESAFALGLIVTAIAYAYHVWIMCLPYWA